uniref:Uncharacterized protein n=1 Tax=Arundo donax TaxID=35708 RepID=A0A0A9GUL1_ARUDO
MSYSSVPALFNSSLYMVTKLVIHVLIKKSC